VHEAASAASALVARNAVSEHPDQVPTKVADHATTISRPQLGDLARAVLTAVAEGDMEGLRMADELADAVLSQHLVERARVLKRLLRERSPFALVRAVELAELLARAIEDDEASIRS
jgi:hypothetical protein